MNVTSGIKILRGLTALSGETHGNLGRCPRLIWGRAVGAEGLMRGVTVLKRGVAENKILRGLTALSGEAHGNLGRCPRLIWGRAVGAELLMSTPTSL